MIAIHETPQEDEVHCMLVVDLDGSLLRSDMLYETFWSSLGNDWRTPFKALRALLSEGIVGLKRSLLESSSVNVATLPYNTYVIDYISGWRERGGRTALVTATDERTAQVIANHLGIFDEFHGTKDGVNLKGHRKANFLVAKFEDGFSYIGDSHVDLSVWAKSDLAITVDASTGLRDEVDSLQVDTEHLSTKSGTLFSHCLKSLRPHQWLKNTLIFVPILAAHKFSSLEVTQALLAFLAFSFVASSVYLFNDLLDLSNDRVHPRKRRRPLASGNLPIAVGTAMAICILIIGCILSSLINYNFLLVVFLYFLITSSYSLYLKRLVVMDIIALAGLYTVRIIAGGVATATPISEWLLAFSMFFFLSLAAIKRQAELMDTRDRGKSNPLGRGYQTDDLQVVSQIAITAGYVSVLVMALYVLSPAVIVLYRTPLMLLGACLILLYWISRVVMVTHRGGMHDDPIVFAAKDRTSYVCLFLILAIASSGAWL